MSDEEKKAIEYWKIHMEILHWNTQLASEHYIKVLLDLVEKQSKEIEELKEDRKKYPIAMNDKQYKKVIELAQKDIKEELDRQINARIVNEEFIETNFISKDKIKAKIEEYKKQQKEEPDAYLCIKVLRSLLEKE